MLGEVDDSTCLPGDERIGRVDHAPVLARTVARDREPETSGRDARPHGHPFERGHLAQEPEASAGRAEAHHPLNACPVVPRAVADDHLACGRKVPNVAREEALALLALAWGWGQRHRPRRPQVDAPRELLDRAVPAGSSALDQDDEFLPAPLSPGLPLERIGPKPGLLRFAASSFESAAVGVFAGLEVLVDGPRRRGRKVARRGGGARRAGRRIGARRMLRRAEAFRSLPVECMSASARAGCGGAACAASRGRFPAPGAALAPAAASGCAARTSDTRPPGRGSNLKVPTSTIAPRRRSWTPVPRAPRKPA